MNETNHRFAVAAARRERMRMRLIHTALEIAARGGPGALSIDAVTAAAEVARGTFYRYFDSTEELVRELAVRLTNELISMAESVVRHHADPVERTACGVRIVVAISIRYPVIAGFLTRLAWADIHENQLLLAFVRRDLEEGLRQQRFGGVSIQLAINIVAGATLGSIHSLLQPGTPASFADQATASALIALGVDRGEAVRISSMPLALPDGPLDGLMALVAAAPPLPVATGSAP